MKSLVIALALALASPLAAFADTPPHALHAPPPPVQQAPDPALATAIKQADGWRQIAVYYRSEYIAANDQLAAALAICGAPCSQPQQQGTPHQ